MKQIVYLDSKEMYIDDIRLDNCSIKARLRRDYWDIVTEQSDEWHTDICTFYGSLHDCGIIKIDNLDQLELLEKNDIKVINEDGYMYYLSNIEVISVEDKVVKFKINEKED
ncbi:hypothetical protein QOZ83_16545 [Romboutsia sedimentorum]|uniref:hypothetical protein n=1 Tax=Romboutsia sedimentorum TaxID=1368474 RepID=UPI0024DED856|nr:hypothetical protein [Romboutsia sedimentorum]MDK2587450.1 hypothetical protein [Romboutsia sedimentorum]